MFSSWADDLVPGGTNAAADVLPRDLLAGTPAGASVSNTGAEANGGAGWPSIADSGALAIEMALSAGLEPSVAP